VSDHSSTALLIMDMQRGVVSRLEAAAPLPARLAEVATTARAAGMPVIYVGVGYLPGHPEIGPRSGFTQLKAGNAFVIGDPAAAVHDDLTVAPGDVTVTKKRFSAFSGSELELVLRSKDITSLVLTGMVTSGVVLSTVRDAADRDLELTVLSDGCVDYDDEVHRVLTEKVFPRQASVVTIAEWSAAVRPDRA
jgi:nicotinamidase-related amidase